MKQKNNLHGFPSLVFFLGCERIRIYIASPNKVLQSLQIHLVFIISDNNLSQDLALLNQSRMNSRKGRTFTGSNEVLLTNLLWCWASKKMFPCVVFLWSHRGLVVTWVSGGLLPLSSGQQQNNTPCAYFLLRKRLKTGGYIVLYTKVDIHHPFLIGPLPGHSLLIEDRCPFPAGLASVEPASVISVKSTQSLYKWLSHGELLWGWIKSIRQ